MTTLLGGIVGIRTYFQLLSCQSCASVSSPAKCARDAGPDRGAEPAADGGRGFEARCSSPVRNRARKPQSTRCYHTSGWPREMLMSRARGGLAPRLIDGAEINTLGTLKFITNFT